MKKKIKKKNMRSIVRNGTTSVHLMYDFLTLGNGLDRIATKYGISKKKLIDLRSAIFASVNKQNEEHDKETTEEGEKEFVLEASGVSEWRHAETSKAVHRLLDGEDPNKVAKDTGYSKDFLDTMKMVTVRHLLLSTLEHTLENPEATFPEVLKSWAASHQIEVSF